MSDRALRFIALEDLQPIVEKMVASGRTVSVDGRNVRVSSFSVKRKVNYIDVTTFGGPPCYVLGLPSQTTAEFVLEVDSHNELIDVAQESRMAGIEIDEVVDTGPFKMRIRGAFDVRKATIIAFEPPLRIRIEAVARDQITYEQVDGYELPDERALRFA